MLKEKLYLIKELLANLKKIKKFKDELYSLFDNLDYVFASFMRHNTQLNFSIDNSKVEYSTINISNSDFFLTFPYRSKSQNGMEFQLFSYDSTDYEKYDIQHKNSRITNVFDWLPEKIELYFLMICLIPIIFVFGIAEVLCEFIRSCKKSIALFKLFRNLTHSCNSSNAFIEQLQAIADIAKLIKYMAVLDESAIENLDTFNKINNKLPKHEIYILFTLFFVHLTFPNSEEQSKFLLSMWDEHFVSKFSETTKILLEQNEKYNYREDNLEMQGFLAEIERIKFKHDLDSSLDVKKLPGAKKISKI